MAGDKGTVADFIASMDQLNQRHLRILVGIGVVVIFVFFALTQVLLPRVVVPPALPNRPAGTANFLPQDLRVISGLVVEKIDQGMTVEWSVPQSAVNPGAMRKETKHITWTAQTVFDRVRLGAGVAAPQAARAADIRQGDSVQVFAAETVQAHYELTAVQVRVLLPPVSS
ncbi:hypothetical protein HY573_01140 [Candidatus Parcubacteria bacterium]|nr:hypothetical protein [Candidatus Parcubacteria bacterium]